jgi:predicted site-specific integrase-resolvase
MVEKVYTAQEVTEILRISRTALCALVKKGALKPIRIGGRTMFPDSTLT